MTALYLFTGISLILISFSPYYRMTALILAASCGFYAFIQPLTQVESGLVYTAYVVIDFMVFCAILLYGDEKKEWIAALLLGMIALNTWSVWDYYTFEWLAQYQNEVGVTINILTVMQAIVMFDGLGTIGGVLSNGVGAVYRIFARSANRVLGFISNTSNNSRTDP